MKPVIIDVREPDEFSTSHVEGALNIPVGEILHAGEALLDLDKDGQYIVYCQSGGRAEQAKTALEKLGYSQVVNGINQNRIESS